MLSAQLLGLAEWRGYSGRYVARHFKEGGGGGGEGRRRDPRVPSSVALWPAMARHLKEENWEVQEEWLALLQPPVNSSESRVCLA